MKTDILFFDSTLRDGSHAVRHQIDISIIEQYCSMIDAAGLYTVIVGHGNGLGASSLQVGIAKHSDGQILKTARANLKTTKLGIYMIPGFGTIDDDLIPAIESGVDLFKIGSHCTEADTTKQHIEYLCSRSLETYGILMMSHMATPQKLLEEVRKMESYGAQGVVIMDSAGAMTGDDVRRRIDSLVENTGIRIGFHAHNNLSLAVSNTLIAIDAGASIVDATLRGFGAGAGNCQLEALLAILQKENKTEFPLNLYQLMDVADAVVSQKLGYTGGIDSTSIISGIAGVFSAFAIHVKNAAAQYGVDPRDIFVELGKRKVVGGQEDIVVDVAMNIAQNKKRDDSSYMLESLL
jgi:4-hydroxy 2-oxovalerate aldolase